MLQYRGSLETAVPWSQWQSVSVAAEYLFSWALGSRPSQSRPLQFTRKLLCAA
jgi:hypothetical protein